MKNRIALVLMIVLAFVLRFYKLGSYPALNADEAAIGYNAYSLIQTGMDEHSNSWPIHFESFGDYKPGLYFYLVLPFVKFFGLNTWSVRIPGALSGVATVYLIYLLVKELFEKKSKFTLFTFHFSIGEIAAFMLAISPWHIHFSRGGWEVNVATLFITTGVYLFLLSRKRRSLVILQFSVIFFVLSLYTYHAARIIVPLLVLGLTFLYKDHLKSNFKNYIIAGLIGLVSILPLVKDFTKPDISSRATGVGLFADVGPLNRINEQRGEHADYSSTDTKLLHNKFVNYGLAFLENWGEHFHGEFLFLSGDDIERDKVPETGQMYILDLLWLVIGVWCMVKRWEKGSKIVLFWVIIAPIAAALTFQSPHALRSHNMVIPLTIISAIGLSNAIVWIKENVNIKSLQATGYLLIATLISCQFARYLHMYWVHMAKEYPFSSQYGVKELVNYIEKEGGKYDKIVITDRYDQPYILSLFYMKYPPKVFQENHELTPRDKFGFSTVTHFDRYHFQEINFEELVKDKSNDLIVGTDEEIYDEANIVREIYGSNGYKYFEVVAN
ncbi:ArnT family glycosyltransferase [Patescibacteria group bacterium]